MELPRFGLRNIYEWVSALPLWARLLLQLGVGALGGSVVVAASSRFAGDFYALRHGMRVPFEGVPYLSFVTGLMTVLVVLVSYLTLVFLYYFVRVTLWSAKVRKEKASSDPTGDAIWLGLVSLVLLVASILSTYFDLSIKGFVIGAAAGVTMGSLLNYLAMHSPKMFQAMPSLSSLGGSLFVLTLLFTENYDALLRVLRVGGGIEVQFSRADGGRVDGYLLLLTDKRVIVADGKGTITEYREDDVASVVYAQFPKWKRIYQSPNLDDQWQYLPKKPPEVQPEAPKAQPEQKPQPAI